MSKLRNSQRSRGISNFDFVRFLLNLVISFISLNIVGSYTINLLGFAFLPVFTWIVLGTSCVIALFYNFPNKSIQRPHFSEFEIYSGALYFFITSLRIGTPIWEGRDPTAYSIESRLFQISGKFLTPISRDPFRNFQQGSFNGPAHSVVGNNIQNQFMHGLPVAAGSLARITSDYGNFLIGPLAIAISGVLISRILKLLNPKTKFAFYAQLVLYFSAPILYTSTTIFSEPLVMFANLSAFYFVLLFLETSQVFDLVWVSLSLIIAFATRIDSPLVVLAAVLITLADCKKFSSSSRIALTACLTPPLLFWFIDLMYFSTFYRESMQSNFVAVIAAYLILLFFVFWGRQGFISSSKFKKYLIKVLILAGIVEVISILILGAIHPTPAGILSREPSLRDTWPNNSNFFMINSSLWLSWYFGPLVVIFSLFVAMYFLSRSAAITLPYFLLSAIYILFTAFFSLYPNIASDQPWASRKLVPVLIPVAIFLCFLGIQELGFRGIVNRNIQFLLIGLLSISICAPTLKEVKTSEQRGFLPLIQELCSQVKASTGVILDPSTQLSMGVRVWCNRPATINQGSISNAWEFQVMKSEEIFFYLSSKNENDSHLEKIWQGSSPVNLDALDPTLGQLPFTYQAGQQISLYLYKFV